MRAPQTLATALLLSLCAVLHADPAPAPENSPAPSANASAAAKAFCDSVGGMLEGCITTWETVHSGKPAFPFIVDRVARQAAASARAVIYANQKTATRLLTNEQLLKGQLMVAMSEHGLDATKLPAETLPALVKYMQNFCNRTANFYAEGTICVVGFGSGDHESRSGYYPTGPKTTRGRCFNATFLTWLAGAL
jgi:hypothetical protein